MINVLDRAAQLGQSIWYDHLRRAMIANGELERLVETGVVGITSNPTIFDQAISGSADYDASLQALAAEGHSVEEIYEQLILEDIAAAADILYPTYDRTGGADGYVSLEVRPTLAGDTTGSIAEARRLFNALARPNVMIKIPATPQGIPAIETLTAEGINVNVTLIFSLSQYRAVAEV
jgi:transaldolase / glucose-6-phosphate isomerase